MPVAEKMNKGNIVSPSLAAGTISLFDLEEGALFFRQNYPSESPMTNMKSKQTGWQTKLWIKKAAAR
jgi:hypothetical protein